MVREDMLQAARRRLIRGRVREAFAILDRAVREGGSLSDPGLEILSGALRLALLYQRPGLARRWIAAALRRQARSGAREPGAEDVRREIHLLGLRIRFSEEGPLRIDQDLEEAFAAIRQWKPWMLHFRWLHLLNRHRVADLGALLRRPPPVAILRGTPEYAARLACLGIRFALDRRPREARRVLSCALREIGPADRPEAIHERATILAWLARATAELGDRDAAGRLVREAASMARKFRSFPLQSLVGNTAAYIQYQGGGYEQALREHLAICFAPSRRNVRDRSTVAMALLNGARCAFKLGRHGQSRRLVLRARPLVRACPYPQLQGYLRLLEGDLRREQAAPADLRQARKLYDAAEGIFRTQGDGCLWWLGQVCLSRGALCLREQRPVEALREAARVLELGRQEGAVDLQAESILLKSHLLLEKDIPCLDIYEDLLRQLGLIRDPVVMFQVVANLYLYSWDLEEHIELTALHLRQLSDLRDLLPEGTFRQLYRTLVSERVFARFRRRFGGECQEALS